MHACMHPAVALCFRALVKLKDMHVCTAPTRYHETDHLAQAEFVSWGRVPHTQTVVQLTVGLART